MNLIQTQSFEANRIVGLLPMESESKWQYESAPIDRFADLQRVQVLTATVIGTPQPGLRELITIRDEERLVGEPINEHAFSTARELPGLVNIVFHGVPPVPLVAPDSEGGIRIEWFHAEANIRAVIAAASEEDSYVYFRKNEESAVKPFSASTVVGAYVGAVSNQDTLSELCPISTPLSILASTELSRRSLGIREHLGESSVLLLCCAGAKRVCHFSSLRHNVQ
jgi:hypothetical protein